MEKSQEVKKPSVTVATGDRIPRVFEKYLERMRRDKPTSEVAEEREMANKGKESGSSVDFFQQAAPQISAENPIETSESTTESDQTESNEKTEKTEDHKTEPKQQKPELPDLDITMDTAAWTRLYSQLLITAIMRNSANIIAETAARHLVITSPSFVAHDELDLIVEDSADLTGANIVRIDASDIAELAGKYINPAAHGPGSISGLPYDTYEGGKASGPESISIDSADMEETPTDSEVRSEDVEYISSDGAGNPLKSHLDFMKRAKKTLEKALGSRAEFGISFASPPRSMAQQQSASRGDDKIEADENVEELNAWQKLKLRDFFDQICSADRLKTESNKSVNDAVDDFTRQKFHNFTSLFKHPTRRRELFAIDSKARDVFRKRVERTRITMEDYRLQLAHHLKSTFGNDSPASTEISQVTTVDSTLFSGKATIIHLRDIHLIYETPNGEDIIKTLTKVVRKKQKAGEQIMIVGTSAEFSGEDFTPLSPAEDDELVRDENFISLLYQTSNTFGLPVLASTNISTYPVQPGYGRLLELNLRSILSTIHKLGFEVSDRIFSEFTRTLLYAPSTQRLSTWALTPIQVEEIVLIAEGMRSLYSTSNQLEMIHVASAASIIELVTKSNMNGPIPASATIIYGHAPERPMSDGTSSPNNESSRPNKRSFTNPPKRKLNLDELRRVTSKHEQRLFPGIVDPQSIRTTYSDVHVSPNTIDALKTITTLSLLRPEAFSYGVLATDRLPGLLLYGPPGTGKTLLAKAVAKDSSATVLEISGAQVYEKYVGEGEKMVKAVFSLAKKLSPCVVFIDEADALFGSRGQSGNRTTHREIINQFLREWDGMEDHSVFMMVATNRPFDLDDAVLRRLPRRILVDLPSPKDRAEILKIHLKGEQLDSEVDLQKLADQTPFYSGSDLKNICVAAALSAVKEENELLENSRKKEGEASYELPEKRTLMNKHFKQAVFEISASISEDMSSLSAIKKFDEKYGDRRGRRKKRGYGFDAGGSGTSQEEKVDESAARVRGDENNAGKKP